MNRTKFYLILVSAIIILAACTGNAETNVEIVNTVMAEEPEDTDVPPTPEPTATEQMVMLPVSMVSAPVGDVDYNQYKVSFPSFAPLEFDVSELPAPPGTVTANWFTSGGFYVVAYYGVDLETAGALCPGNSIFTDASGWIHISNAPTEEGACEGFPTLTDDPAVGPVDCHGELFYRTAIPSDLQGTLYGTIEMLDPDGNLVGITSQVNSSTDMLEIDLAAMCQ